jgi:DnaK suppressor protein
MQPSLYAAQTISAEELSLALGQFDGGETVMGASTKTDKEDNIINNLSKDFDPDYVPNDAEEFMSDRQLKFFEQQLHNWRHDILEESRGTLNQLQDAPIREPDMNDRASSETDWSIELRTRDRQRKLISKIEAALNRISEGEYGYCQVTGEPISLARLRARPIATMTLEAQERHERQERISRDD